MSIGDARNHHRTSAQEAIIAKSAEPSGEDPDVGAYLRGSDYYTTLESKGDVR